MPHDKGASAKEGQWVKARNGTHRLIKEPKNRSRGEWGKRVMAEEKGTPQNGRGKEER